MRGLALILLACALTVCGTPIMPSAWGGPRVGTKKAKRSRPDADKAYSLDDIMKAPKEYSEREVFFYCRYASSANLFKNINTRFNANEHANFAVWPDKAVLWDSKERKNVLPTLYVAKNNPEMLEILRNLEKYELIAVTGRVMDTYSGYPWILVTKIERSQVPGDKLCEPVIEHMQNGHDALTANSGGVAARHFEQAIQFGLPSEYRAKAYEQLAQAYLLDNQLDKAQSYLRQAVEQDPSDPILNLALADVSLRMEDPGEALAHCTFALERSGRHPQVYGIMGEARSLSGDFVKAFQDLNAASGTPGITSREKAMVNVRRARIYTRAGRHPDAARVYAASTEPGEALAGEAWLHNEVGLFYEMLYLDTGDPRYLDSAYMAYEEAARLNRLDAGFLYNMTEIEFRRQRLAPYPDFTLAKELINRINQVEPEYTAARILEGRVLFAENKANEAEFRYQSVSGQIGNDAQALLALAEAYMDIGRYLDAGTAIRRARRLQPWNLRVQALGCHLEELSQAAEVARGGSQRSFFDSSTLNEPWQREEFDRYIEPREVWRPRALPQWPPEQEYYSQMRSDPRVDGRYGFAARGDFAPASRSGDPRGADRRNVPAASRVTVRPGEGIRVDADGRARTESSRPYPPEIQASARPAMAPGESERPYPKTEVRLPAQGQKTESGPKKTSAKPAPLDLGYTPAFESDPETEITARRPEPREEQREFRDGEWEEVPERMWSEREYREASRAGRQEPGRDEYGYANERRESFRPAPREEYRDYGRDDYRRDEYREPARDGYREDYREDYRGARRDDRGEGYRDDRRYEERGGYRDERRDGYRDNRPTRGDDRYEERYDDRREYRDERNRYGQAPSRGEAYASIPAWGHDESGHDLAQSPDAFSFESDASPVIIAEMRAPEASEREMPVRNVNVYRKNSGTRRPAEIIERDPVQLRRADDRSAMAPAGDGKVRRAEVRLPSSSQGVGMASDYDWDN